MPEITLCTLNAKHIHASLGLRYLYANLGNLQANAAIREFTLDPWPIDIAEQLLADEPKIIGFGVYIWNREQTEQLIRLLKSLRPELIIIIGGPEVSFEWQHDPLVGYADYLVTGQADLLFAELCRRLLQGERPVEKALHATPPPLDHIQLPYDYYSDEDIAHRLIYVEASRGCPFKCEFCLSALDKTAKPFPRADFLSALKSLHQRGVRHFKFVDRTFNLNPKQSAEILDFFLNRLDPDLFLHFEVIPDHLPEALKQKLQQFPAGSLQLEVGIQTFNPQVQETISRKQDNNKSQVNLHWLRQHSHAHLHTDLIIGLPGEAIDSFADSFDRLIALNPHEVQVGILKRLKGSPIIRHSKTYDMRYNPNPPFNILSNRDIDFATMQRLNRFARYWEMIANSGRFPTTLPLLLGDTPFANFLGISNWLFDTTGQVHRIALKRLFDLLYKAMTTSLRLQDKVVYEALRSDFIRSGMRGQPSFLAGEVISKKGVKKRQDSRKARQERHEESS